MPKKFTTQNSKAMAAKARKALAQELELDQKKKQEEDASWEDKDKAVLKKAQREEERSRKVQKKQTQLSKKAENDAILQEEVGHSKATSSKVTRESISSQMHPKAGKRSLNKLPPLVENLNRLQDEVVEAHSISEAIQVLQGQDQSDLHPERRMKSAYLSFVETNLPILKKEHPTLRLSQLKEMLRKDWKQSCNNLPEK